MSILTRAQSVWKTATDLDYPLSRLRGHSAKAIRTIAFLSVAADAHSGSLPALTGGIEQLIVRGAQSVFEERRISTHIYKSGAGIDHMRTQIEANYISGLGIPRRHIRS